MSTELAMSTAAVSGSASRRTRDAALCLVVHDELELRLRLAGLVRRAVPSLDADTATRAGFEAMGLERIRAYAAVMFILEFNALEAAAGSLATLERLRNQLPQLPIFIFARGGNERTAARAMKIGATDYWPIHSVLVGELRDALLPVLASRRAVPAISIAGDRWRQPDIAGYTLIKKIADSTTASVYLAKNGEFPHPVALKVQAIKGLHPLSQSDRLRFSRECEILATLNHRSIANVLDFGITEDYLYLALEYFPCGSLRERLKHPISEGEAVNYARQIGEALQIVHASHIVHRDLKPSNLMLTHDNRIVLIDFGSARAQYVPQELMRSDSCTGTPYYVSPEQIENRDSDGRCDLYSLGIVFYEMLAGTLPFVRDNLADLLTDHRKSPVPDLPQRVRHFQPIVERLLAKDPRDRFESADGFLGGLDAAATDLKIGNHNQSMWSL